MFSLLFLRIQETVSVNLTFSPWTPAWDLTVGKILGELSVWPQLHSSCQAWAQGSRAAFCLLPHKHSFCILYLHIISRLTKAFVSHWQCEKNQTYLLVGSWLGAINIWMSATQVLSWDKRYLQDVSYIFFFLRYYHPSTRNFKENLSLFPATGQSDLWLLTRYVTFNGVPPSG